MEQQRKYNPFDTKDYFIIEKNGKRYFKYNNLELELCKDGFIPKSGLLFDMVMNEEICKGKDVLDLGCGYLGILGVIAHFNGAKNVNSIDYDPKCIEWFNKLIKENNLEHMNCFLSNYYEKISQDQKYDIVLANPPQMPMKEGSLHDSGGEDGRIFILDIMKQTINYLKENGSLYILLFDFLGIDVRTSSQESLVEIATKIGYQNSEIMFEAIKSIKPGSVTWESIPHINSIYPLYDFVTGDNVECKIKILRLDK